MNISKNKVKLFIVLAIFIVFVLIGVSILQISLINKKQKEIDTQKNQIAQLEQQLEYYSNN